MFPLTLVPLPTPTLHARFGNMRAHTRTHKCTHGRHNMPRYSAWTTFLMLSGFDNSAASQKAKDNYTFWMEEAAKCDAGEASPEILAFTEIQLDHFPDHTAIVEEPRPVGDEQLCPSQEEDPPQDVFRAVASVQPAQADVLTSLTRRCTTPAALPSPTGAGAGGKSVSFSFGAHTRSPREADN